MAKTVVHTLSSHLPCTTGARSCETHLGSFGLWNCRGEPPLNVVLQYQRLYYQQEAKTARSGEFSRAERGRRSPSDGACGMHHYGTAGQRKDVG
jgi:hypothetical protein